MSVENIKYNGKTFALIVRAGIEVPDNEVKFLTPDDYPLQLALHNRSNPVQSHYHPINERTIKRTEKIIIIQEGTSLIEFYDETNKKKLGETRIEKGDIILFKEGAHSMKFSEKTKFIEIKQGPFLPDDKVKFDYDEVHSSG